MAKISNYALVAYLASGATLTSADCTGDISTFSGECTYEKFGNNLKTGCTIAELYPNGDAEAQVEKICRYDAPVQFVEIMGTYQRDRRYFKGSGPLVDEKVDGGYESARLERFEENMGSKALIGFPEYAARMKYNKDNGRLATEDNPNGYPANMNLFASCQLNTVMCCFTDDSNGDGFDANGDDTTDVCRHDLHDSPQSNHIKRGWSVFPGAETPTHCRGFTWKDGEEELLGNMMYDISYRTTINKGYLKGIPGAPMCGCVEHMPTVETAQCRTATKTGDIQFTFTNDGVKVSASNTADITYKDCDNRDLKGQFVANNQGDETKIAAMDDRLVGDAGCEDDLTEYLNGEQFLQEHKHPTKYVDPEPDAWELVVGEGTRFFPSSEAQVEEDASFRQLIDAGCEDSDGNDRHCIIRRVCDSCTSEPHRDIYYKRLTALPPPSTESGGVNLLRLFMSYWNNKPANNMAAGDFALYSTYDDAREGTNAWTYCAYSTSSVGFPHNCGPTGAVHSQWNSYARGGAYADHHAFYVELPQ
mmetsp:Transcript_3648/g.8251  ORF Transcript_3648/g.8251 Transcript_3648/m.8251 type:complete len:532 (+) Transcript_3648:536-2131(+)